MREKILKSLQIAESNLNELSIYSRVLPENLINGALNAYENSIPLLGNQILELLNSVDSQSIFSPISTTKELIQLFTKEVDLLEEAFDKVPVNKNIVGATMGKIYSAKEMMDDLIFQLNSHCDSITMTLTTGKLSANHGI